MFTIKNAHADSSHSKANMCVPSVTAPCKTPAKKKKKNRWEFPASCRIYLWVAGTSIRQPVDGICITPPVQVRAVGELYRCLKWRTVDWLQRLLRMKWIKAKETIKHDTEFRGLSCSTAAAFVCKFLYVHETKSPTHSILILNWFKNTLFRLLFKAEIFHVAAELKELAFILSETGCTSFTAPWRCEKIVFQILWLHQRESYGAILYFICFLGFGTSLQVVKLFSKMLRWVKLHLSFYQHERRRSWLNFEIFARHVPLSLV